MADKIAQGQYVENYFITESANINSSAIDPAQSSSATSEFTRDFSSFTLSGSNGSDFLDFVLGHVKLTAGRMPTGDEVKSGASVVVISQDVATANNLLPGDSIPLSMATQTRKGANSGGAPGQGGMTGTTSGDESDYQIIGLYEAVLDGFYVNTMFTSNNTICKLRGTTASDETTGSIVFLLDSPEHIDAFKEESAPYLTSTYHILYSDDTEYNTLTKPLNILSFITSILIWIVFVAGAAIIVTLVTIFVRDRKFEIGLLLSSGEGRLKIVSQFVLEMLVIVVLAFLLSTASSSLISKGVSSWIADNQLLSTSSLIGSTAAMALDTETSPFRDFRQSSVSLYGAINMQSVADEFNVSVDGLVVSELMLTSVLLILIGSAVPLSIIMGFKPRRIMQDDH